MEVFKLLKKGTIKAENEGGENIEANVGDIIEVRGKLSGSRNISIKGTNPFGSASFSINLD